MESAKPFPEPVLDLGCGDGHFAASLSPGTMIGVDPDASRIREARARGSHCRTIVAAGEQLPFPAGSMGSVIANSVLEHIPRVDAVLVEISRILRPGGRLLLTVPSQAFGELLLGSHFFRQVGLKSAAAAYARWFNWHSRHYHTDSPETWRSRLECRGFTVDAWSYYLSPAAHRAFDLLHYLSLPRLVNRTITGRWVGASAPFANRLYHRWLAPLSRSSVSPGPYLFMAATRGSADRVQPR